MVVGADHGIAPLKTFYVCGFFVNGLFSSFEFFVTLKCLRKSVPLRNKNENQRWIEAKRH